MPKPEGNQAENQASETVSVEDFNKLSEQIENLNKGIATYRDEAKTAKEIAAQAQEALSAYKKEADETGKKPDTSDLSAEDQAKFDAWAKKKGYVTKDVLDKDKRERVTSEQRNIESLATTEFLEKYPEYDSDEMWAKVTQEFTLYKTPTDIAGYRALLERIHNNLSGGKKASDDATARAKAEAKKKAFLTISTSKEGSADAKKYEQTIDALQEKYPNLTRDQIVERVSEIQALDSE